LQIIYIQLWNKICKILGEKNCFK